MHEMLNLVPALSAGFVEGIAYVLVSFFNIFFYTLFSPVVSCIYIITVWAPLQTIEAICILFKFFSSGFLINIFEGQQNPDGTYSYNFNWSGMLGTTIIFIATIAFALFFINFLMTFSQRYALDENGSPVTAQSRRLYYLKWPIIMVLLLIGTPYVLVTIDSLMNSLMTIAGNGDISSSISEYEINNIRNMIVSNDPGSASAVRRIMNALSTPQLYGQKTFSDYFTSVFVSFQGLTDALAYSNVSNKNDLLAEINNWEKIATSIQAFGEQQFGSIAVELNKIVNGIVPGSYISSTASEYLKEAVEKIRTAQDNMYMFASYYTKITNYDNRYGRIFITAKNLATDATPYTEFENTLWDYTTAYNEQTSFAYAAFNSLEDESAINVLITGDGSNAIGGIRRLSNRFSGYQTVKLVKNLFMYVTGCSDGDRWDDFPGTSGSDSFSLIEDMSLIQFAIAGIACFSMILITYQFLVVVIKRNFSLIIYWLIGWLYLANGIKDAKAVKVWYRKLFGTWMSVLIFFITFQSATILLDILHDPISSAMENIEPTTLINSGPIGIDNQHIFASFALLLAMEAMFQVAYQFANTVTEQLWHVRQEAFSAGQSVMMSSGQSIGAGVYGFATDRFSDVWQAPGKVFDTINKPFTWSQWWRNAYEMSMIGSNFKAKQEFDRLKSLEDLEHKLNQKGLTLKARGFWAGGEFYVKKMDQDTSTKYQRRHKTVRVPIPIKKKRKKSFTPAPPIAPEKIAPPDQPDSPAPAAPAKMKKIKNAPTGFPYRTKRNGKGKVLIGKGPPTPPPGIRQEPTPVPFAPPPGNPPKSTLMKVPKEPDVVKPILIGEGVSRPIVERSTSSQNKGSASNHSSSRDCTDQQSPKITRIKSPRGLLESHTMIAKEDWYIVNGKIQKASQIQGPLPSGGKIRKGTAVNIIFEPDGTIDPAFGAKIDWSNSKVSLDDQAKFNQALLSTVAGKKMNQVFGGPNSLFIHATENAYASRLHDVDTGEGLGALQCGTTSNYGRPAKLMYAQPGTIADFANAGAVDLNDIPTTRKLEYIRDRIFGRGVNPPTPGMPNYYKYLQIQKLIDLSRTTDAQGNLIGSDIPLSNVVIEAEPDARGNRNMKIPFAVNRFVVHDDWELQANNGKPKWPSYQEVTPQTIGDLANGLLAGTAYIFDEPRKNSAIWKKTDEKFRQNIFTATTFQGLALDRNKAGIDSRFPVPQMTSGDAKKERGELGFVEIPSICFTTTNYDRNMFNEKLDVPGNVHGVTGLSKQEYQKKYPPKVLRYEYHYKLDANGQPTTEQLENPYADPNASPEEKLLWPVYDQEPVWRPTLTAGAGGTASRLSDNDKLTLELLNEISNKRWEQQKNNYVPERFALHAQDPNYVPGDLAGHNTNLLNLSWQIQNPDERQVAEDVFDAKVRKMLSEHPYVTYIGGAPSPQRIAELEYERSRYEKAHDLAMRMHTQAVQSLVNQGVNHALAIQQVGSPTQFAGPAIQQLMADELAEYQQAVQDHADYTAYQNDYDAWKIEKMNHDAQQKNFAASQRAYEIAEAVRQPINDVLIDQTITPEERYEKIQKIIDDDKAAQLKKNGQYRDPLQNQSFGKDLRETMMELKDFAAKDLQTRKAAVDAKNEWLQYLKEQKHDIEDEMQQLNNDHSMSDDERESRLRTLQEEWGTAQAQRKYLKDRYGGSVTEDKIDQRARELAKQLRKDEKALLISQGMTEADAKLAVHQQNKLNEYELKARAAAQDEAKMELNNQVRNMHFQDNIDEDEEHSGIDPDQRRSAIHIRQTIDPVTHEKIDLDDDETWFAGTHREVVEQHNENLQNKAKQIQNDYLNEWKKYYGALPTQDFRTQMNRQTYDQAGDVASAEMVPTPLPAELNFFSWPDGTDAPTADELANMSDADKQRWEKKKVPNYEKYINNRIQNHNARLWYQTADSDEFKKHLIQQGITNPDADDYQELHDEALQQYVVNHPDFIAHAADTDKLERFGFYDRKLWENSHQHLRDSYDPNRPLPVYSSAHVDATTFEDQNNFNAPVQDGTYAYPGYIKTVGGINPNEYTKHLSEYANYQEYSFDWGKGQQGAQNYATNPNINNGLLLSKAEWQRQKNLYEKGYSQTPPTYAEVALNRASPDVQQTLTTDEDIHYALPNFTQKMVNKVDAVTNKPIFKDRFGNETFDEYENIYDSNGALIETIPTQPNLLPVYHDGYGNETLAPTDSQGRRNKPFMQQPEGPMRPIFKDNYDQALGDDGAADINRLPINSTVEEWQLAPQRYEHVKNVETYADFLNNRNHFMANEAALQAAAARRHQVYKPNVDRQIYHTKAPFNLGDDDADELYPDWNINEEQFNALKKDYQDVYLPATRKGQTDSTDIYAVQAGPSEFPDDYMTYRKMLDTGQIRNGLYKKIPIEPGETYKHHVEDEFGHPLYYQVDPTDPYNPNKILRNPDGAPLLTTTPTPQKLTQDITNEGDNPDFGIMQYPTEAEFIAMRETYKHDREVARQHANLPHAPKLGESYGEYAENVDYKHRARKYNEQHFPIPKIYDENEWTHEHSRGATGDDFDGYQNYQEYIQSTTGGIKPVSESDLMLAREAARLSHQDLYNKQMKEEYANQVKITQELNNNTQLQANLQLNINALAGQTDQASLNQLAQLQADLANAQQNEQALFQQRAAISAKLAIAPKIVKADAQHPKSPTGQYDQQMEEYQLKKAERDDAQSEVDRLAQLSLDSDNKINAWTAKEQALLNNAPNPATATPADIKKYNDDLAEAQLKLQKWNYRKRDAVADLPQAQAALQNAQADYYTAKGNVVLTPPPTHFILPDIEYDQHRQNFPTEADQKLQELEDKYAFEQAYLAQWGHKKPAKELHTKYENDAKVKEAEAKLNVTDKDLKFLQDLDAKHGPVFVPDLTNQPPPTANGIVQQLWNDELLRQQQEWQDKHDAIATGIARATQKYTTALNEHRDTLADADAHYTSIIGKYDQKILNHDNSAQTASTALANAHAALSNFDQLNPRPVINGASTVNDATAYKKWEADREKLINDIAAANQTLDAENQKIDKWERRKYLASMTDEPPLPIRQSRVSQLTPEQWGIAKAQEEAKYELEEREAKWRKEKELQHAKFHVNIVDPKTRMEKMVDLDLPSPFAPRPLHKGILFNELPQAQQQILINAHDSELQAEARRDALIDQVHQRAEAIHDNSQRIHKYGEAKLVEHQEQNDQQQQQYEQELHRWRVEHFYPGSNAYDEAEKNIQNLKSRADQGDQVAQTKYQEIQNSWKSKVANSWEHKAQDINDEFTHVTQHITDRDDRDAQTLFTEQQAMQKSFANYQTLLNNKKKYIRDAMNDPTRPVDEETALKKYDQALSHEQHNYLVSANNAAKAYDKYQGSNVTNQTNFGAQTKELSWINQEYQASITNNTVRPEALTDEQAAANWYSSVNKQINRKTGNLIEPDPAHNEPGVSFLPKGHSELKEQLEAENERRAQNEKLFPLEEGADGLYSRSKQPRMTTISNPDLVDEQFAPFSPTRKPQDIDLDDELRPAISPDLDDDHTTDHEDAVHTFNRFARSPNTLALEPAHVNVLTLDQDQVRKIMHERQENYQRVAEEFNTRQNDAIDAFNEYADEWNRSQGLYDPSYKWQHYQHFAGDRAELTDNEREYQKVLQRHEEENQRPALERVWDEDSKTYVEPSAEQLKKAEKARAFRQEQEYIDARRKIALEQNQTYNTESANPYFYQNVDDPLQKFNRNNTANHVADTEALPTGPLKRWANSAPGEFATTLFNNDGRQQRREWGSRRFEQPGYWRFHGTGDEYDKWWGTNYETEGLYDLPPVHERNPDTEHPNLKNIPHSEGTDPLKNPDNYDYVYGGFKLKREYRPHSTDHVTNEFNRPYHYGVPTHLQRMQAERYGRPYEIKTEDGPTNPSLFVKQRPSKKTS